MEEPAAEVYFTAIKRPPPWFNEPSGEDDVMLTEDSMNSDWLIPIQSSSMFGLPTIGVVRLVVSLVTAETVPAVSNSPSSLRSHSTDRPVVPVHADLKYVYRRVATFGRKSSERVPEENE